MVTRFLRNCLVCMGRNGLLSRLNRPIPQGMPLAVEVNAYLHDGETRKAEALGVLLQVNLVHGGLSALVQLQLHDIEVSLLLSSKSRSFFSMCLAVLMSNTYLPTLLADTKSLHFLAHYRQKNTA